MKIEKRPQRKKPTNTNYPSKRNVNIDKGEGVKIELGKPL